MYVHTMLKDMYNGSNWVFFLQETINRVILLSMDNIHKITDLTKSMDPLKIYMTPNALCKLSECNKFIDLFNKWNKLNPSAHVINLFSDLYEDDDPAYTKAPDIPLLTDVLDMLSDMMTPEFGTYWEGLPTFKHIDKIDTTDLFMVCCYGDTEYYVTVDGLGYMLTQTYAKTTFK